jgi:hypothetical protein
VGSSQCTSSNTISASLSAASSPHAGDQHDATFTVPDLFPTSQQQLEFFFAAVQGRDRRGLPRLETVFDVTRPRDLADVDRLRKTLAHERAGGVAWRGHFKSDSRQQIGERCRAIRLGSPDLKLGVAPTMRYQRHPWRAAPDAPSTIAADGSSRRARREADCPWRASGLLSGASALVCFHT